MQDYELAYQKLVAATNEVRVATAVAMLRSEQQLGTLALLFQKPADLDNHTNVLNALIELFPHQLRVDIISGFEFLGQCAQGKLRLGQTLHNFDLSFANITAINQRIDEAKCRRPDLLTSAF